jgi:cyclohexyl-isocyanide hydratase
LPFTVGLLLFPDLTQLDLTGPYEVFSRMPDTTVQLIAATLVPVRSERGLTITPDTTFERVRDLDLVCVPGGAGVNPMMEDEPLLELLRGQGRRARYVTSVCTGALLLGAAGLLRGYRATTHWLSLDLLPLFGAHPVDERVVVDRNRITGGGVTAGIDFGLFVASHVSGSAVAQETQLALEYNPAPALHSGSPRTAPQSVVDSVVSARQTAKSKRRAIAERAAARLDRAQMNSRA